MPQKCRFWSFQMPLKLEAEMTPSGAQWHSLKYNNNHQRNYLKELMWDGGWCLWCQRMIFGDTTVTFWVSSPCDIRKWHKQVTCWHSWSCLESLSIQYQSRLLLFVYWETAMLSKLELLVVAGLQIFVLLPNIGSGDNIRIASGISCLWAYIQTYT